MIPGEKRGGNTYSKANPIEKVAVHKRTHSVLHEVEIKYEGWGMADNGSLKVFLHVYISKFGLLITDKHPGFNSDAKEINLSWEYLDEIRKELGVEIPTPNS